MLAYVLALAIGFGSFAFYMAAFFFPEVHRKSDFYLSGGGLFYALVLWVCAGRITGWVLLSQIASVSLLYWLGWQTLTMRRMLTSPEQQTAIPNQDQLASNLPGALQPVTNFLANLLGKTKSAIPTPKPPVGSTQDTTQKPQELQEPEVPTQEEETILEPSPEAVAEVTQEPEVSAQEEETILEPSPETLMEAPELPSTPVTSPEEPEENLASTKKQGVVQKVTGLFEGFFGKSKPATQIPLGKPEISAITEPVATESSEAEISEITEPITTESSDAEISEIAEAIVAQSSDAEISETAEPIVAQSSDAEISETAEPIVAQSSDAEISETAEPIATESSDADSSESVELIPPKPPLPELLEEQEKSASSDASESKKKTKVKIEEIAPEVELAPPAEPTGDGDPQVRSNK